MGVDPGGAPPLDTTKPNVARIWDYWLGGKDHFAADREHAGRMLEICPLSAQMARENRQFLYRSVSYVASQGIRQFIDVGAGLPTAVNTHEIARRVVPDAKVAYLDHDPLVVRHAEALLATSPGVIALPGDASDPEAILADPALRALIDFAEPACVVACGVLHFLDIAVARKTAAALIQGVAAGSYLIMSVGTGDPDVAGEFAAAYTAASLRIFSPGQFASLFDGLEVMPPGLVPARGWTVSPDPPALKHREASFLVGVGRKPA